MTKKPKGPRPGASGAARDDTAGATVPESDHECAARFTFTDLGNANRLVREHGRDLLHVEALGWFVWDGTRFRRDETGEIVRRAKSVVEKMRDDAAAVEDDGLREAFRMHAKASASHARIKAMIELAKSHRSIACTPADLDADPWALNVSNGIIDLRTGLLRPHDRAARCTKLAPVAYDPAATALTWDRFLRRIFDGDDDLIAFVQRALGYAATGVIREHVLHVLYGTGANGKSTLIRAMMDVLGDYGAMAAPRLLMRRHGDAHPTELADLRGTRFVATCETAEGGLLDEERAKLLSGGDMIKARMMRQDFFSFVPTFKLHLATNHRPNIRGQDLGIWRRLRLWPFVVAIPVEEQDALLNAKLQDEAPGILAWIVQGCLLWQLHGLREASSVQAATERYRADSDHVGDWIEDSCRTGDPADWEKGGELYKSYATWCEANGVRALDGTSLGEALTERGHLPEKRNGFKMRRGIAIKQGVPP